MDRPGPSPLRSALACSLAGLALACTRHVPGAAPIAKGTAAPPPSPIAPELVTRSAITRPLQAAWNQGVYFRTYNFDFPTGVFSSQPATSDFGQVDFEADGDSSGAKSYFIAQRTALSHPVVVYFQDESSLGYDALKQAPATGWGFSGGPQPYLAIASGSVVAFQITTPPATASTYGKLRVTFAGPSNQGPEIVFDYTYDAATGSTVL